MPKAPRDNNNPYQRLIDLRERRLSDWDSNFDDPAYNKVKDLDLSEHWEKFNPWTDIGFHPYPVLPLDVVLDRVVQAIFDKYDIPYDITNMDSYLPYPLGVLPGLDIRNQQASQMVNLSCAEALKKGKFIEVYMDGDGIARLRSIGETHPGKLDIRYAVPTGVFRFPIDVVTVTGWDPPPYQWVGSQWRNYLSNGQLIELPDIQDVECRSLELKKVALIKYDKPLIVSQWNDMIRSEYELNSWDRFIGCIYLIDWEGGAPYSTLTFSEQTREWVYIDPYHLNVYRYTANRNEAIQVPGTLTYCWLDESEPIFTYGSGVTIGPFYHYEAQWNRNVSDLESVSKVLLLGHRVTDYIVYYGGLIPHPMMTCFVDVVKYLVDLSPDTYALKEYYDNDGFLYYKLIFKQYYDNEYSLDWVGHIQEIGDRNYVFVDPTFSSTLYDYRYPYSTPSVDGFYIADFAGSLAGWVVSKIWVEVTRRYPSVVIHSTKSDAEELAETLTIKYLPIIITDLPAPKAVVTSTSVPYPMNKIIDPQSCAPDADPRTVQDYLDSECYKLEEDMMGNVMEFSFPFLNAEECLDVANTLFDILEQEEDINQMTYICGPDSEPVLGGSFPLGSRNIINTIEYSYQDSSAYHITVTTGPSNFRSSFSSALFSLQTEDYTAPAIVQKSAGNGWLYLVDVFGFGLIPAVNMTTQSLDVGDEVTATIHNNPVFSWGGRY